MHHDFKGVLSLNKEKYRADLSLKKRKMKGKEKNLKERLCILQIININGKSEWKIHLTCLKNKKILSIQL